MSQQDFTKQQIAGETALLNLIAAKFDAGEDITIINLNSQQAIVLRAVFTRRFNIGGKDAKPQVIYTSPFGDHVIQFVPGAGQ